MRSHRPHDLSAFALSALGAVLTASLAGCQSPAPDAAAEAEEATQAARRAPFALGYRPSQDGADAAIARAQREVADEPDDAGRYVKLAEAFLVRRRETADAALLGYARDALKAAAELAPRDPAVLTTEIYFHLDAHKFADAARAAREVVALAPEDATGNLLLSDALLELGDYAGAIAAVEAADAVRPDLRTYSRISYLRWLHGDTEGALEAMDAALGLAGGKNVEPAAWCAVDLGRMMWHAGKLDEALNAARYALRLIPDYPQAKALEAQALRSLGRADEAAAILTALVERAPNAADLVLLADIHADAGRAAEAARYLAQAEKSAGHHPLPLALHYARRAAQGGDHAARALELADAAVAERPTVFHHDARALALLRLGRADEAAEAMARALALGTPDAAFHLHRGLVELARGDAAAARAALARARKLDPHADPLLAAELERGLAAR